MRTRACFTEIFQCCARLYSVFPRNKKLIINSSVSVNLIRSNQSLNAQNSSTALFLLWRLGMFSAKKSFEDTIEQICCRLRIVFLALAIAFLIKYCGRLSR